MPSHLPRFHARYQRIEDERKLARILLETGEAAPKQSAGVTAGGDRDRMRGLPLHARGVSGTMPHTDPLGALLAKER